MQYWIENCRINSRISKYIYNGIDVDYFNECNDNTQLHVRSKYNISKGDIVIGSVAALRREKNQEDIIKAATILRKKGYPVKILLVGDGVRRAILEDTARSCGIFEHFSITGFQEDVRPFVSAMDCFVISSSHIETFSMAALEAMALGKSIVMTDIGGASEIVREGVNGFLYAPGEVDSLAGYIEFMIKKNLFQSMGKRSRDIVRKCFTHEKMVTDYESLLSEITKKPNML
jgi:glycosyltransferase involved in cell wall biosynthesis